MQGTTNEYDIYHLFNNIFQCYSNTLQMGHMEKQEMEMKQKLEMETENGNWKWKWEQKTHQSLVHCFLHSVLSHCSCIVLRIVSQARPNQPQH